MEQYIVHVTHHCNLRCKYCYEDDRETTYTQEEILDTCQQIVQTEEPFGIEFIGGEPLLAFDNIKVAYEFFETNGRVSEYVISTNLSCLTKEMLEWLKPRENIRLSISLDGGRYSNQLRVFENGLSSYEKVTQNIAHALRELGERRVGVHMVTHPYNVAILASSVDHIYGLGIRSIAVGIIEKTIEWGGEFMKRWLLEMGKVSRRIAEGRYPGLTISEFDHVKPPTDSRTYVYDENGKQIFESYGRNNDDAITRGEVNAVPVSSPISKEIAFLRWAVFTMHEARTNKYPQMKLDGITLGDPEIVWRDKTSTPENTLARIEALLPFDVTIDTFKTGENFYTTLLKIDNFPIFKTAGKGSTPIASEVSALAEMVERIEGAAFPCPVYGLMEDPYTILDHMSFKGRDQGYSLITGEQVHIDMPHIRLTHGSNGIAAGNTVEEAIIQATCEVFERYCLASSAMTTDTLYPTINPATIESEEIRKQLRFFSDAGYDVFIKDISWDVFPTVGVFFVNTKKAVDDMTRYSYICAGAMDSDIAISRCLMEKVQVGMDSKGCDIDSMPEMESLTDNARTRKDLTHLMKGKVINYEPRKSKGILKDLFEIRAICLELGLDHKFIVLGDKYLPVVQVVIKGKSSMEVFYKEKQMKEELILSDPNVLLKW